MNADSGDAQYGRKAWPAGQIAPKRLRESA